MSSVNFPLNTPLAFSAERRVCLSPPLRRLSVIFAALMMLTSSFDLVLIVQAGGNFRFSQIAGLALFVLAVMRLRRHAAIPTLGGLSLCTWLVVQILFVPVSAFWPKSVGYCSWLALNAATMFSLVQLFSDDERSLAAVLRWYVYSFGVIAMFGILQFLLPLVGYSGVLVQQWWIPDRLARVNGFSYEPSYFATYLLIGAVFMRSLTHSKSSLLPSRTLSLMYWLSMAAIVVSSSRMGIAFAALDLVLYQFRPWASFCRDFLRCRLLPRHLRAVVPSVITGCLIAAVSAGIVKTAQRNPELVLMFFAGTGISNTTAHSVLERENSLGDTFAVFLEHPLIGRSLGGVSSAIAGLHGETIKSFQDGKAFEGMNVFAEALAASGLIGIVPFIAFLIVTVRKPLKLARIACPWYASILRALLRSLLFGWAILQFNQNMLRPYVWVHIALLAAAYGAAVRSVRLGLSKASD
jgi:hypothetical protein